MSDIYNKIVNLDIYELVVDLDMLFANPGKARSQFTNTVVNNKLKIIT